MAVNYAQTKIDSLQLVYNNALEDSVKIKTLHQLHNVYKDIDSEKAKETILKSIELSKSGINKKLSLKSYSTYGDFLYSQSAYDSAIVIHKIGLEIAKNINDAKGQSSSLLDLGDCYLRKGNFEKALEYQKENLSIAEKTGDTKAIAYSYNSMGLIKSQQGEYTKAMEYYINASQLLLQLGLTSDYAKTLLNVAVIQRSLGNYESAKGYLLKTDTIFKQLNAPRMRAFIMQELTTIYKETGELDKAIKYNKNAQVAYEELGDKRNMARVTSALGDIYVEGKNYAQAVEPYNKAIQVFAELQDSINLAYTATDLGIAYFQLNDNKNAKNNLNRALTISKTIDLDLITMSSNEFLAKIYASEGNFAKAYESQSEYAILKDSLYTKEKRDLASEIEAKYQNEEKAKENALLAKDNDLQALKLTQRVNERNVLIAFALVALIVGLLIYNQFRIKQKANKKLQELDRLKSNFFTNISHEFRTPLTLIKGPIEQLEQNPEEQLSTENVKMIRRNANRLLKLVNQLLELSKSDEGSLKLEPTEGDIYKCLRAVTSSFNSHAAQRHIDYRVTIPQSVLWTSFDRDKIEKIVYNLLSNAFKFSEDGAVIRCDVQYNTPNFSIEVSDSGTGIPKEKLPLIFDRFYQLDHTYSKGYEGSGIGLSIAKAYVDIMDGTITVSSEVNKGTYFNVQISLQEIKTRTEPIEDIVLIPAEKLQKKPYQLSEIDKRKLPVILLIEDNEDMRHFIREQLIATYRINEAVNGQEGLSEAIANPPDLIITDLMMPKMDGMEVCKKLKTTLATSHIPVIMLTAKAGLDNKLEGLETGADDYLTKPFNANELLVRTKNLIEQRQKLRELFTSTDLQMDPKKITVTSIDQKFIQDILSILESEYSDSDFGVQQMQQELAMSKAQLHRKIKALTNEAPGELLRNFRLKRAAQLLRQEADSVTQIAFMVGFNNLSYFAKCFKELYGVTPSTYLQSLP